MSLFEVSLRSLIALCVAVALLPTPEAVSAAEYDDVPKTILESFAKGDVAGAIDYAHTVSTSWDQTSTDLMRKQTVHALSNSGAYRYHELIGEKKVGTRIVRQTYIVGYDTYVLEVIVTLYRPKDQWRVMNLKFLPDVDTIFENAPQK